MIDVKKRAPFRGHPRKVSWPAMLWRRVAGKKLTEKVEFPVHSEATLKILWLSSPRK
jgi:hypothetical protein